MESNFINTVESLFGGMEKFISSKTVVGEPIHVGDTIILPLVDVSFGVGAGASEGKKNEDAKGTGAGGLAAKITPSAILIIKEGQTKLVNIKNQDSLTKIIDMVPDIMDKFTAGNKKKTVDNKSELSKTTEEV